MKKDPVTMGPPATEPPTREAVWVVRCARCKRVEHTASAQATTFVARLSTPEGVREVTHGDLCVGCRDTLMGVLDDAEALRKASPRRGAAPARASVKPPAT